MRRDIGYDVVLVSILPHGCVPERERSGAVRA